MDDRQDVAVYEGTPGWMAPAFPRRVVIKGFPFLEGGDGRDYPEA